MKNYYAIEYISGWRTTTGQPNKKTGKLSHAINCMVFSSKSNRDEWIERGEITSDMGGNCRESVTKRQLRSLCLGDSLREFNEYIDSITP